MCWPVAGRHSQLLGRLGYSTLFRGKPMQILVPCKWPIFFNIVIDTYRHKANTYNYIIMAYWLIKSEPFKYSWDQFVNDKQTFWDGVRNYAARNNLKAMKKGEEVLFYHSNEGVEVVGIAKVAKEFYQDPTTEEAAWVVVDFKPVKKLKKAVPLELIKKDPRLANMDLVRLGRLSVQTVKQAEWDIIMEMAGEKK
jgi:predicted RNA-binding protein with PUA-like domain